MGYTFPFALVHTLLLSLIFVLHSLSIILLCLALAARSGGLFQAFPMGVNWIGLIVVGCFLLHRVVHVERSRARNLVTFGALSVVGFANSIVFIVRLRTSDDGSLCGDFIGMANGCMVAHAVVINACSVTVLAVFGCIVSYIDHVPGIVKVIPCVCPSCRLALKRASSRSLEACQVYCKDTEEKYPSNKWSEIPL